MLCIDPWNGGAADVVDRLEHIVHCSAQLLGRFSKGGGPVWVDTTGCDFSYWSRVALISFLALGLHQNILLCKECTSSGKSSGGL
jgi:hypothetical protein